MKRVGDGGRTMVFDMKDEETTMEERVEMEDLCSRLASLIPQDYLPVDTSSQGAADLPSQLMHATAYIKDLRERVEQLKQRRDNCYAKIQQVSKSSSSSSVLQTTATPGSCSHSQEIRVQFDGAAHFDVNLRMSSENRVQLHMVIHAIEEDGCIEIVEASSCVVEDGDIVHLIKCRAISSVVPLDASMVETRIKRLFIT